jgi:hypothetical protein
MINQENIKPELSEISPEPETPKPFSEISVTSEKPLPGRIVRLPRQSSCCPIR